MSLVSSPSGHPAPTCVRHYPIWNRHRHHSLW